METVTYRVNGIWISTRVHYVDYDTIYDDINNILHLNKGQRHEFIGGNFGKFIANCRRLSDVTIDF